MQPQIRSGYYKHLQIESGWRLDTRVLNVTLADCSDPAVFIAFDIGSRKVICSSPHKDGLSALIDVLNRAIRKHGAPSQVICELSPEFHSSSFEKWALLRNIHLYFVPPSSPQRVRQPE